MNGHKIKDAIRKARRNIKIAQKEKNTYSESYWRGVVFGMRVRADEAKIVHLPKREKTKKQIRKKHADVFTWK